MHKEEVCRVVKMGDDVVDATLRGLHNLRYHVVPGLVEVSQTIPYGLLLSPLLRRGFGASLGIDR